MIFKRASHRWSLELEILLLGWGFWSLFIFLFLCGAVWMVVGSRGLEVRGDGVGSSLPLDIYSGCPRWHGSHHSAGALSLRRPRTHRQATVQDFQHCPQSASAQKCNLKITKQIALFSLLSLSRHYWLFLLLFFLFMCQFTRRPFLFLSLCFSSGCLFVCFF